MKNKPSKFAGILHTRKATTAEAKNPGPPLPKESAGMIPVAEKGKHGRPGGRGKRVNPNFAQVTAYIPKSLHTSTKINLIRLGNKEFSQLIEELLMSWNLDQ